MEIASYGGKIRTRSKINLNQNTFYIIPTDANNYKITGMLKTIKIPITAPTCFGSRRNHHQGPISCLAKTTVMILSCSSLIIVLAKHEIGP